MRLFWFVLGVWAFSSKNPGFAFFCYLMWLMAKPKKAPKKEAPTDTRTDSAREAAKTLY